MGKALLGTTSKSWISPSRVASLALHFVLALELTLKKEGLGQHELLPEQAELLQALFEVAVPHDGAASIRFVARCGDFGS